MLFRCMWSLLLDVTMSFKGLLFLDVIQTNGLSCIFYCIDEQNGTYSFWRCKFGETPAILADGLSKEDARFKLSILGLK